MHKVTQRTSEDVRFNYPLANDCMEDRKELCPNEQPVRTACHLSCALGCSFLLNAVVSFASAKGIYPFLYQATTTNKQPSSTPCCFEGSTFHRRGRRG